MKTKIILMCFTLLFWIACATAPAPRIIQNSFQIDASYDVVWSAIIETFADLQIPIDNMEKDSGLITTNAIDFTGQTNEGYCDCGGLGLAIERSRAGKFNVFLKRVSENSCELKVNCMFEQIIELGDERYGRDCVSTGNLEKEIYKRVLAIVIK